MTRGVFQEYLWILTLKNILTNHIDISIMPYVSPSCKIKIWLTSSPLSLYSNDSYTYNKYNIRKNPFIYFVFSCWKISINLMMLGFSISKNYGSIRRLMVLIIHQPDRHGIIIIIQPSEKHSTRKTRGAKILKATCVALKSRLTYEVRPGYRNVMKV